MTGTDRIRGAAGQAQDSEIVFQKPLGGSIFSLAFSLLLLLSPAFWVFVGVSGGRAYSPPQTAVLWSLCLLLSGFGLAIGVFYFLMSFPSETRIDTERRTFEYVNCRWLRGTSVLRGSLEEVSGICVTGQGNVLLALKKHRGLLYGLEMGRAGSRKRGEALAEGLSLRLRLPIIKVSW